MIKVFLLGTVMAMSATAFAETNQTENNVNYYDIKFTDKLNTVNASITTQIGEITPVQIAKVDPEKSTDCNIELKNDVTTTNLKVENPNDTGYSMTAYPMEIDGDYVRFMLVYKQRVDYSASDVSYMKDNCVFANNVSHTINVNWVGEVKLNEPTSIALSKYNDLYINIRAHQVN